MNTKRIDFSVDDFENHMNSLPDTINVVGNAESLLDKKLGSEIDQHYTIRFNWLRFKEHPVSLGTRCDWLHNNYIERMTRSYIDGKMLLTANRDIRDIIIDQRIRKGVITFLPEEVTNYYYDIYPQNPESSRYGRQYPSLGYFFLQMLADYRPDIALNIYGFDFKETPSHYIDYPTEMNKFHDYYFEKTAVLELAENHNWNIR